jgi:hypothetical protein
LKDGIYTDITAKDLLDSEADAVKVIIETITTLVVLEVQTILNAIISALATGRICPLSIIASESSRPKEIKVAD